MSGMERLKEQFVPYELAVKLKELGFDEECFGYSYRDTPDQKSSLNIYFAKQHINNSSLKEDKGIALPLWQQAFDWFRENHDFDLCIKPMSFAGVTQYYDIEIHHPKYVWDAPPKVTGETYEEARLSCLNKLIELCQQN